ncbi:sugar O-acetyltransferase [Rhodospirillaceae bacterium SYSU D60014]|uniref:sugar O-acetyltransferase n=1 Tax=Virgifigura deserti TaxID=2268457 RepID=UPI000E6611C3
MTDQSEKEKMLAGVLYRASDPELVAERRSARALVRAYNATTGDDPEERIALLRRLFGEVGPDVEIEPSFACDYGYNIRVGRNLFVNFGGVFLDCAPITIGDDVQIGPQVQIYTAKHPIDAAERRAGLESAAPVVIGNGAWIGGGAIVLPGVTIGDETVVGAGSIVTRNLPAGVVAVGNPCRIIRRCNGDKPNL